MLILLVILYKGLFLDNIIDGWKVHPYDESEFQQISALSSFSASLTIELVELVFAGEVHYLWSVWYVKLPLKFVPFLEFYDLV